MDGLPRPAQRPTPDNPHLSSDPDQPRTTPAFTAGAFADFDALFRHVPFGAGLIDRELRYARVNQALADFNGKTVEEHLGRTIREVIPEFADEVAPILRAVLESGQPGPVVDSRLPLPGRAGESRAIRIRFFPVEENGVVTHVGAIFADIEDQWRAQETLRASEERFRTVFEAAPSGIVMTDGAGRITLVNQEIERAFGYARSELLGRPADLLLPGLPPPGVGDGAGPAPRVSRDLEAHRADGTSFPVDVALTPLPGGALLATVSDVTERKRTEDALREQEAEARRLALVAARTTNGVVITDNQGRTEWINEGFVRLTGFDIDELRGRRPGDVLQVPGTDPATVEYIRECVTNRRPFAEEVLNRRKDGTLFWVRVDAAPLFADDGTFTGYITIQTDVTERREATDALRASEERYRAFIALATEGVYRFEAEQDLQITLPPDVQVERMLRGARLAECNDAFARMYGFERAEELVGKPLKTFLLPEDPQTDAFLRQFVEQRYRLSEVETRERGGGGRYFSNALFGVVEDDLLVRAWGIQRDVTAQRRAEEALRESEERFRLALEGGRMGTFDWDLVTDALVVDTREAELCGRSQEELSTGQAFFDGVHPEDVEPLRTAVEVAMTGQGDYATEFRYIRPDGDVRWLAGRGHVVLEDGRPMRMMGLNFDVTERRRAEEELRRRTVEMEQFTYTVSHDLKSPLVTITGFLGMLETHVEAGRPERARVAVDRIRRAAGRMSELIDDLLELSRVGRVRGEITAVDVNALVEEVADGLRRRMAAARCRFRIRGSLPRVRADERRLAEAFENLFTNALKYACAAGATGVEVWSEIVDDEVRYVVEDNGPGIPPEYHRTIFDLFQRLGGPEAEGTGMGLAIVSKIMEVHDGRAWVESTPGEGARFYLAFPRTALVTGSAPPPVAPSTDS